MDGVAPDYQHHDKFCTPREAALVGGASFKWYDIALAETPVDDNIAALARAFVARLPTPPGDGGFVILHRCGANFYFLILQTWRGNNEIWESVYAKRGEDADFALWDRPEPHLPTYCVWELGAVWHERGAWRRFLLSPRDEAARAAHRVDMYQGPV
jgi:hypothetical protein